MPNHIERPTQRQVADWLGQLAVLLPVQGTLEDAGQRLRAMIPMLVDRYGTSDFDASSREFVARHCTVHFPTYGQLCELLDRWPKPAPKAERPTVVNDDLSIEDWAWVAFYHKRRADIWAQQGGFKWGNRDADLANLSSLVRGQSSKAWAHVSGEPVFVPRVPSESELAYVANLLRPPPMPSSQMPVETTVVRPKPAPVSDRLIARMREERGMAVP